MPHGPNCNATLRLSFCITLQQCTNVFIIGLELYNDIAIIAITLPHGNDYNTTPFCVILLMMRNNAQMCAHHGIGSAQ